MDKDNIKTIYINNFEFINKSFKRKNKNYGTSFEEKMLNLWICNGELMTNKPIKNYKDFENIKLRVNLDMMNFIYENGYLVSYFLKDVCKCDTYKFQCIY
jgi:hypothetical protein